MRKLLILKKRLELSAIFVLFFLLSLPHLIDLCAGYLGYVGYDVQEFLLWNYASFRNIIPYRDIFYPYGILQYYKNYNLLFMVLNYVITPLMFTIFYFLFKKIFKNRYFLYISSFFLFLFVFIVTGLDVFSRYGIFISFSLLYSYLLYSKKTYSGLKKLFVGLILGLIFSFVNDQGSYLIFLYIFLYFFNEAVNKKIKFTLKYCKNLVIDNMVQGIGFFFGLMPLLAYLVISNSLKGYFKYFRDVQNIAIVAKTPFFSFITSPANLFTISVLFLAVFFLLINNLYLKKRLSLSSYFQITLIFDILLLEQKSIIRSVDKQITFVSFILCILLFYEFVQLLSKYKIRDASIRFLFSSILIAIIFVSFLKFSINQFKYFDLGRVINASINNRCYVDNLNLFLSQNNEYISVIKELKKEPGFNGKVFSFPTGDSIFYIILNQKPPYYNAIFEGSSQSDQFQTINYLQNNNIKFVILNTDTKYVQDAVPDYIRQPAVFKYIINTYYPFKKIGNHLILKINGEKDFFFSELLTQSIFFKKYLLNVYLYKIPYSEGLYKYALLKKTKPLIEASDIKTVNGILEKNNFDLSDKTIVMIPSQNLPSSFINYVSLRSSTGEISTIFYNPCRKENACIINLKNIPFFYKSRIAKQVKVDGGFKGRVIIFDSKNRDDLW
ncbi:hypothetical protein M1146_00580 [Patescibacteria group bacterium]|nr:hypothetical protein [Patescibacteria group bacterium]